MTSKLLETRDVEPDKLAEHDETVDELRDAEKRYSANQSPKTVLVEDSLEFLY
jgi:hypothetical protein